MAHYNDMREFLEELKKRGDLMVIDKKVSPVHEICAFTRKASDMGGPALLFTNVEGYDMPVLSGLYGTRERVHLALGLGDDTKSVIKEYVAHENKFIPPVTVGDDEAPVHEVVLTGDAVDLYKLPILTNFEKDLGPYITAGVQMANDPITGVRNSSMHRMLLLDKNHMTCFAPKGRHLVPLSNATRTTERARRSPRSSAATPSSPSRHSAGRHWAPMRWAWPAACGARR